MKNVEARPTSHTMKSQCPLWQSCPHLYQRESAQYFIQENNPNWLMSDKHPGTHCIIFTSGLNYIWKCVFSKRLSLQGRVFRMWPLDPIQLRLQVTGGHSFLAEILQSPLCELRTEAQKENVGEFHCYKNITCLFIITTGGGMTNELSHITKRD